MDKYTIAEQAWKNGYLTALADVEQKLDIDHETFKQIVQELLRYRQLLTTGDDAEDA